MLPKIATQFSLVETRIFAPSFYSVNQSAENSLWFHAMRKTPLSHWKILYLVNIYGCI